MKTFVAAACAAALAAQAQNARPKPPSTDDLLVADLASAKWIGSPTPGIPPGAEVAVIGVDPTTGGATGYAKFPAGYHLPLHWHSHTEYATLLSGSGKLTIAGKEHVLAPGSYAIIPPRAQHEFTCVAGAECVLLTRRGGPLDYNFVKPEAPRR